LSAIALCWTKTFWESLLSKGKQALSDDQTADFAKSSIWY